MRKLITILNKTPIKVIGTSSLPNKLKAIKVVTGHGSGKLRKSVREGCHYQEGRFKGVIYGEDYDMFNKNAVDMRSECNQPDDDDFGRNNSAITYIWLW